MVAEWLVGPSPQRTSHADGERLSKSVASSCKSRAGGASDGKVAGGEREEWEKEKTERRESNTLHTVLHLPQQQQQPQHAAVACREWRIVAQ